MFRLRVSWLLCLFLFLLVPGSQAADVQYLQASVCTGGGSTALDGIDGNGDEFVAALAEGDIAFVGKSSFDMCIYYLDSDASCTETSETPCPLWVKPDSNPGTKCWKLMDLRKYSANGSIFFTNSSWNCDLDGDGSCSDTDEADPNLGVSELQFQPTNSYDEKADSVIVQLPYNFDETDDTVSVDIYWTSDATSGNVMWCMWYTNTDGDDDDWTTLTEECLDSADATSSDDVNKSSDTSVTNAIVDAWEAGDLIQLRIEREATDALDTINSDDVGLVGVRLNFNTIN